jgi:putative acetyltransferase
MPAPQPLPVDPDSAEARRLIAMSDALLSSLYPVESNHLEDVESLLLPNVRFLGIRDADTLVACGAVKLMDDDGVYGEIKRVFVIPEARGHGHARRMMQALESILRTEGLDLARLETGIEQPEALGLYRALGYRERGPFGSYSTDPLSVFMEKSLSEGA